MQSYTRNLSMVLELAIAEKVITNNLKENRRESHTNNTHISHKLDPNFSLIVWGVWGVWEGWGVGRKRRN